MKKTIFIILCVISLGYCTWAYGVEFYPFSGNLPSLKGDTPLNSPLNTIYTHWDNGFKRKIVHQNKYNPHIVNAARRWDKADVLIIKSMLAQESSFTAKPKNRHGYKGIAQLGRKEARLAGLSVTKNNDERLDPERAIEACVTIMRNKAERLNKTVFKKYGTPKGDEYWKFIAAAYNAGEGTVARAIRIAYGNSKPDSVVFKDLLQKKNTSKYDSALYKAIPKHWGKNRKYKEISEFAMHVVNRARQ